MSRITVVLAVGAVVAAGCSEAPQAMPAAGPAPEQASEALWLTDFEQAKQVAAEKKRPILVNFSGSDWCSWCIRLDKEVFSQAIFKQYAGEDLVLFVADFPRGKKLPDKVRLQNEALAEKHGVRGFPTVLLLDAAGKTVATTGYRPGGAEAYVAHLRGLLGGGT